VFCLAVFLLFTSVSTAPAAQAGPFYIGVFGGYVIPSDLEIENSADVSLKSSWAIGAKAGYIFPQVKWLAAELEYFYLAKQDIDQSGSSGDFSANNVMANLLVRYPEGKIHPYAGIGIGWSWGTFKATSSGNSIDESANAFAWQILAGVNFEITQDWSADVAYRYFSSKYDMGSDPSSDVTTKDNMFLLGINYHF
ncbi:MAG: outer membrane protein, partial [Syntrophales bacterium]